MVTNNLFLDKIPHKWGSAFDIGQTITTDLRIQLLKVKHTLDTSGSFHQYSIFEEKIKSKLGSAFDLRQKTEPASNFQKL